MTPQHEHMTNPPGPQHARQIRLGIYGYGEVGHGLALGLGKAGLQSIVAYQRDAQRPLVQERARVSGVTLVDTPAALAAQSDLIIAVTQGAQCVPAAQAIAAALTAAHVYVDLAAATPGIKQEVARIVAPSACTFADGAIEGSPLEYEHRFPILVSGPGAAPCAALLNPWGTRIASVGVEIGRATAIKGLRSVMMKGFIGLLVECSVAARHYGIEDEVFATVSEWFDALPFMTNANRLLRTTAVHAGRRADEAAMTAAIVAEAGVEPVMTNAAVDLLRRIDRLGLREQLGGVLPADAAAAVTLMQPYATTLK